VFENSVPGRPRDPRVLDMLGQDARADFLEARARRDAQASENSPQIALFKKAMEYELAFVKAGGLLAAGLDPSGGGGNLAGFGDQRNYELLVEAGFTPSQAIQVVSANGAKVLGVLDKVGTVTAGKEADLVVLEGDITANPAAIKNTRIVFKDGVG